MAPAKPPRCRTPNYPAESVARGQGERDLNTSLVGPHSAIQARRSSRVLEAHAWAGRAEHTVRFSGPVRCVQMLIMLMGRRLSLSVMRGLNRETALLRSIRSLLIPHRAHLLFPARLLPMACKVPTRRKELIRVFETPSGRY